MLLSNNSQESIFDVTVSFGRHPSLFWLVFPMICSYSSTAQSFWKVKVQSFANNMGTCCFHFDIALSGIHHNFVIHNERNNKLHLLPPSESTPGSIVSPRMCDNVWLRLQYHCPYMGSTNFYCILDMDHNPPHSKSHTFLPYSEDSHNYTANNPGKTCLCNHRTQLLLCNTLCNISFDRCSSS